MIDGLSLEDWNKLWEAISRSAGHEVIVDSLTVPPGEVRVKVVFFLRRVRAKIVSDLRERAAQHKGASFVNDLTILIFTKNNPTSRTSESFMRR